MKMESDGDMSSGARSLFWRGALAFAFFSDLSSEDSAVLEGSADSVASSEVSLVASFLVLDFFLDFFFSAPSAVLESDSEAAAAASVGLA